jgi:hypothetical protein
VVGGRLQERTATSVTQVPTEQINAVSVHGTPDS